MIHGLMEFWHLHDNLNTASLFSQTEACSINKSTA